MTRYIDAEKLEKDGWSVSRIYQQDAKTMIYEIKKITDFPTADVVESKRGKWEIKWDIPCCSVCHKFSVLKTPYCGMCGAEMKGEDK